jgi:probable HAF family extracellular repeat protein
LEIDLRLPRVCLIVAMGAFVAVLCPPLAAQPSIIDIGTLGGAESVLYAVNDRHEAVGWSTVTTSQTDRAVLWRDGHLVDLGALPEHTASRALDINNRGLVVGMSIDFALSRASAVLWRDGVATDISVPGNTVCRGVGINNLDHVALSCDVQGWLWRDGEAVDLGILPGYYFSSLSAINDHDVVVGRMSDFQGHSTAFRWERGILTDLGAQADAFDSVATAINTRGQVVGYAVLPGGNFEFEPVLWDGGRVIRPGTTMGTYRGIAFGINDRGEIVGEARRLDGSGGGFVWADGRYRFLDQPGYARDINIAGVAVGQYAVPDRPELHGVIWPKAMTRVPIRPPTP